ncbi:butyrophilin subfamily 1 member A1 [Embiotoca jacksoni]|uniref:butyrophilin subfamily 1 member A1 n=1 Tax=Embiotoca jacksoni TaxID=100190 RepID=UPI0037049DE4
MASIVAVIAVFSAITINAENTLSEFVKVECNVQNVGQHGHQSMLECVVQTSQEVVDATIHRVTWKKKGRDDPLLFFTESRAQMVRGYSFAEPSWNEKNMNVSLLISNTVVADAGDYTCSVSTDSGFAEKTCSLKVQAKYRAPIMRSIPERMTPNEHSTLICTSGGGYPKGKLRWFDMDNEEWTKSSEMEAKQTDEGLFQLSSKLELLPGSTFSKYTCVVFNASGGKEDETTFELQPSPLGHEKGAEISASKIVAPVVVIGSLLVGLLLVLLIYKKRSPCGHQEVPTHDESDKEGDHQEVV